MAEVRRFGWRSRVSFPATLTVSLGFGAEIWKPVAELPDYEALLASASKYRTPIDPRVELTDGLIANVVDAAAAIEFTVERIHVSAELANEGFRTAAIDFSGPQPEYGYHVATSGVWEVYLDFNNLLGWVRTLDERLQRDLPRKAGHIGLLPAIAPGPLGDRVQKLYAGLRSDVLIPNRYLANWAMHAASVPSPMSSTSEADVGGLLFLVPDTPSAFIDNRFDLTWDKKRSAVEAADEILDAVGAFIDGLLDAFEQEAPNRFRKDTASDKSLE